MSTCLTCTSSTPVKVLEPGDLDGGQSPKGKSEDLENITTQNGQNGGRCFTLSGIFNCKMKSKGTKVMKVNSNSPAVSSVDGAQCSPD